MNMGHDVLGSLFAQRIPMAIAMSDRSEEPQSLLWIFEDDRGYQLG